MRVDRWLAILPCDASGKAGHLQIATGLRDKELVLDNRGSRTSSTLANLMPKNDADRRSARFARAVGGLKTSSPWSSYMKKPVGVSAYPG